MRCRFNEIDVLHYMHHNKRYCFTPHFVACGAAHEFSCCRCHEMWTNSNLGEALSNHICAESEHANSDHNLSVVWAIALCSTYKHSAACVRNN
jgi:hypothetical protein